MFSNIASPTLCTARGSLHFYPASSCLPFGRGHACSRPTHPTQPASAPVKRLQQQHSRRRAGCCLRRRSPWRSRWGAAFRSAGAHHDQRCLASCCMHGRMTHASPDTRDHTAVAFLRPPHVPHAARLSRLLASLRGALCMHARIMLRLEPTSRMPPTHRMTAPRPQARLTHACYSGLTPTCCMPLTHTG